jgi:hypothetical protein
MRSRIRVSRFLSFATIVSLAIALVAAGATPASATTPLSRVITQRGTTSLSSAAPAGTGNFARPEIANAEGGEAPGAEAKVHRSKSKGHRDIPSVSATEVDGTAPGKGVSFEGLNHRTQRRANGGNQFSLEPPDQGLCVGAGFVLETVNAVLRVYDTSGVAKTAEAIDMNTFYGYPPQATRDASGAIISQGPFMADPSCYYDPDTARWFHIILTLEVFPTTGDFTGKNHIDLAVSTTSDPRGAWKLYSIAAQNDGTDGTPNHRCSLGPCFGDFPHIGADRNGIFITTNEYSLFGPEFTSAQIYALSKSKLAAGSPTVTLYHFDGLAIGGGPGFTVWPAISPAASEYDTRRGGTEYFLSSMAGEEAGNTTGTDDRIGLWAITNTSSLKSSSADLDLRSRVLDSQMYAVPKPSAQKKGDFPLGQCINDKKMATPFGKGCWQFFFIDEPAHNEVESSIDSSDTRMMQVVYAGGLLYGALDTAVKVDGREQAGIAWFVVRPNPARDGLRGEMTAQGYLAVANNNVTYPAVAVLRNGKGVIAFTLVGADYYATAAYVTFNANDGTSKVHIAKAGTAPHDGFTAYKAFVGDPPRTRWGDYGAAAVFDNKIWIASEYIAQPPCNLATFVAGFAFNCGETRTSLGNWSTRVTQITP